MILGLVFGAVTVAATVSGMDQGAFILFSANPAITVAICFVKGGMAGLCAGLAARSLKQKNVYVSCIFAAITAPIVNTGLFCLAMEMFFHKILVQWAGGTDLVYYVFFGLIGINFLIELGINIVFAPVLIRIIRAVNKTGGHSENPYA
jgi:hypothetical protein